MSSGSVTWIGHATAVVDLAGDRVLLDPLGRGRCRAVQGYQAVLITHAHVDHLNRWTLATLDKQATLYIPQGAGPATAGLGFREVVEVEPGDQLAIGKLEVTCVPTRHDPGRWRKGDGPICTGYMIERDGVTIHHSGDVDMSDHALFDELGGQFDIDATLLPIGGMLPVWYYRWRRNAMDQGVHIDPDTALEIALRLGAKRMVPVHYGTLQVPFGPARTAPRRLAKIAQQADAADRINILGHGQQLKLDKSST